MSDLRETFCEIYEANVWGQAETRSGKGSTMEWTTRIRDRLPALLEWLGVSTLLDAGCGDFHWMQTIELDGIRYHGVDIVPQMIAELEDRFGCESRSFSVADLTSDDLPRCDLILCRTVLFHLSDANAIAALDNFRRSGATWLLATTYPWQGPSRDIVDGRWRRMNLSIAPFRLGEPFLLLPEDVTDPNGAFNAGYLGLWKLEPTEEKE